MSSGKVFIAVDALGADKAPSVVLDGVTKALNQDPNLHIKLCGPENIIVDFCKNVDRCEPVICTQEILMGEHPANAIRKKKDSTIVVGCRLVKEGQADGFFSAGNTGACLAAATLVTGRIKGVLRPMLATNIPCPVNNGQTFFCDLGANADWKPEYILQFGVMAKIYLNAVNGIKSPRIGLLNIGEEEDKGSIQVAQTYKLLKEKLDCFSGNAEGRDLFSGKFDAILTDGFTGNVVLKSIEGSFKASFGLIKNTLLTNLKTKIAALLIKSNLKKQIKKINPEAVGSALLFGVKGVCCVGHGSSSSKAICNGILNTATLKRHNIVKTIEKEIESTL